MTDKRKQPPIRPPTRQELALLVALVIIVALCVIVMRVGA